MKKIILSLVTLFSFAPLLRAQTFEISAGANTGMFALHGPSTTANAEIIGGDQQSNNYVDNPYLNKYAVSYGAFVQPQFVFKSGFMIGLQGSYDILRSSAPVTTIYPYDVYYAPGYYTEAINQQATGNVTLREQTINLNPYVGYRLKAGNINLDIMPGISFGFDMNNREKGSGTIESSHTNYPVDYQLDKYPTDVQLKLGVAANWNKWSLVASYAYGPTNISPIRYYNDVVPDAYPASGSGTEVDNNDYKIHSSLFRLGIAYRLFSEKAR